MRRVLPRSFFGQLVLGTMLVQTALLVFFLWHTVVSQRNDARERSRVRSVQQLDRLSAACARQLERGDTKALHDVLELSRIAPSIEVARLTDFAGNTLGMSENGGEHGLDAYEKTALAKGPEQQVFTIRNGQIEAVTPVLVNGKPVAMLWLEPNRATSLNTMNVAVQVALSYGGFALLANILPIFLITRTMTRPLRRLREATYGVIRSPDMNAGFPLPVTTVNEAGDLTASFNTMVRELEVQRSGLLETLALLDSMLRNAPIGFAFFDRELRYVRLNQFFADISGVPLAEHVGRRGSELFPASMVQQMEAALERVFTTGEAMRDVEISGDKETDEAGQRANLRANERTWLLHFYPVPTQQNTVAWVGVIIVEITERLQAEEALRKTEKLAAAGRLAASVAHEINNPLEAVTNLLYLLETHDGLDATAAEFVRIAQAELARVAEITQQTLQFYRQSTLPTPTNVAEVLNSVLTLYQPRITAAHVAVVKNFRDAEIFGFGGELRQLFANLIGNALDATPAGGRIELRVRRGCGRALDDEWISGVRVCISDTGTGMDKGTLQRMFEAFFTTKQVTGTGLGLWVSQEIIVKHGGTVRVRSRQGTRSGTSFMMFFPDGGLRLSESRKHLITGGSDGEQRISIN